MTFFLNMFYSTILILSFVSHTLPEPLNNFDIIIIPISKELRKNLRTLKTKPRNYFDNRDNSHRIDIENYDEPTEMPDIDNFDYTNDRNDESISRDSIENIDSKRNNVIRYLALRSDTSKNSYKHETDGEDEITDQLSYEDEGNYGENKIVGGQEVDINLYPYHVAYGTNCGGAIIDRKWVITAGHCGKKPYIRVGNKYINQGTKINVRHSYIHPEWPAKNKDHPFDYDFQLLELEENLKFGDNIQPIKIAHIEDMVIGKVVTVTGWGNTKENGPYSNVLRAVRVPIISKENCQHVPFPYFRGGLTSRMFCAGFSEGKKDACQGDSGGPAVAYDRLLGMVSFGYGCATPGSFGVYSKVAKVRSWIEEVTGLKLD